MLAATMVFSVVVVLVAMLATRRESLARTEAAVLHAALSATKVELSQTREQLTVTREELAVIRTALVSASLELATVKAQLSQVNQQLASSTLQLKIEKDVLARVSRLGIRHARRAARLLEALKTSALQRRRWVRIGNQFAHEVSELKGKAATTEALLAIIERILAR